MEVTEKVLAEEAPEEEARSPPLAVEGSSVVADESGGEPDGEGALADAAAVAAAASRGGSDEGVPRGVSRGSA